MSIRPESAEALHRVLRRRWPAALATSSNRLTAKDLDRVVDKRWNPPVTLGVRLISIADDDIQHAGQANYSAASTTAG